MKHHIIVKYAPSVSEKDRLNEEIASLFEKAKLIDGIHSVSFFTSCTDRENRFDIMVVIDMDSSALENWDRSDIHQRWKSEYGKYVEKKSIFDCE